MTKPEHTKSFNVAHAKAGAPYACKDGQVATILKWDGRHTGYPLIGIYGDDDSTMDWALDGRYGNSSRDHLDLVMIPLGFIDGEPVFTDDVIFSRKSLLPNVVQPQWRNFFGCRWPRNKLENLKTGMTEGDVCSVYYNGGAVVGNKAEMEAWFRIANAAIVHALKSGQVVLPDRSPISNVIEDGDTLYFVWGDKAIKIQRDLSRITWEVE